MTEPIKTWTGSIYEGNLKDEWFDGDGSYTFPNGTKYQGQFRRGEFHGKGTLIYPNGGRYIASWKRGIAVEGKYRFSDGLEYQDENWTYLSQNDRRFYSEISEGLNPAGRTKLTNDVVPDVPQGLYDTGEGFYDPVRDILFDYKLQPTATKLSDEAKDWVLSHCRKGFGGLGADGPVMSNEDQIQAEEKDAATKVQSMFRGKQARAAYKTQRAENRAATAVQSCYRGKQARTKVKQKREEKHAATKFQAMYRGKQARSEVDEIRRNSQSARESEGTTGTGNGTMDSIRTYLREVYAKCGVSVLQAKRKQSRELLEDVSAVAIKEVERIQSKEQK